MPQCIFILNFSKADDAEQVFMYLLAIYTFGETTIVYLGAEPILMEVINSIDFIKFFIYFDKSLLSDNFAKFLSHLLRIFPLS